MPKTTTERPTKSTTLTTRGPAKPTTTATVTKSTTTTSPPDNVDVQQVKSNLPGQLFPTTLQCELAVGPDYRPVEGENVSLFICIWL